MKRPYESSEDEDDDDSEDDYVLGGEEVEEGEEEFTDDEADNVENEVRNAPFLLKALDSYNVQEMIDDKQADEQVRTSNVCV